MNTVEKQIKQCYDSKGSLQQTSDQTIRNVLRDFSKQLISQSAQILAANEKDLALMSPSNPLYDRLQLTPKRLAAIAKSILKVCKLPNPAGQILSEKQLPNGLHLSHITTPLGVVAAIFESRPNVVADIASLCIKSHNACLLKGSRDADHTNQAIVKQLHRVLKAYNLPKQLVCLLPPDREVVNHLFTATHYVDVIIPRGSQQLIEFVRKNSQVPVIETGAGVCHVYVHKQAKFSMAVDIVVNAKTSRPSVCNSMDTLLVDQEIAAEFLPLLAPKLEAANVLILADNKSYEILKPYPQLAKSKPVDYDREFISLTCAIKIVPDLEAALQHISRHGTRHSEAIVTQNKKVAEQFLNQVDAAAVYHNASTRFTDGEEFGLGAEVGISTQKLHARGPFALEKLVTEKWLLRGQGQIR